MKYMPCVFALCLAATIVFAQEETNAPAPAVQGPRIFCEQPEFDFGTADSQSVVEHTFIFKNIGDTTLEIGQVKPACGCTVADITPRSVPPGGEATMVARLNLQGRSGHQSKSITINSNDPENPQYRVTMSGNASQSIMASPDRLIFGQMQPGQEVTLSSDIQFTGPQGSFNIVNIETNDANLTATLETVEAGRRYKLNATYKAGGMVGAANATVRLHTDNPQRPVIDLPVIVNVIGELVYAPNELALPAQTDGNPLTRYIVIRPGSLAQFEIKNVVAPDPAIKVNIFPFGGQGYRIQLENITPSDALNGTSVRVETSASYMSVIEIPVRIAR